MGWISCSTRRAATTYNGSSVGGESESNFQAPAGSICRADHTAMQFHDSGGNREADALTRSLVIPARVHSIEGFEDARQIFFGHAGA